MWPYRARMPPRTQGNYPLLGVAEAAQTLANALLELGVLPLEGAVVVPQELKLLVQDLAQHVSLALLHVGFHLVLRQQTLGGVPVRRWAEYFGELWSILCRSGFGILCVVAGRVLHWSTLCTYGFTVLCVQGWAKCLCDICNTLRHRNFLCLDNCYDGLGNHMTRR